MKEIQSLFHIPSSTTTMKSVIPSHSAPFYRLLPPSPPPLPSMPTPIIFAPLSRRLSLAIILTSLPLPSLSAALPSPSPCTFSPTITSKAFLDVSIAGVPAGRIIVGLFGDASPAGAARFSILASGSAGVSYRRKEFAKIAPTFIQNAGIRSYGVDAELARRRSGMTFSTDTLISEFTEGKGCESLRSVPGTVGLVVRNPSIRPPSAKIVAREGRIEVEEDEAEAEPNGTEFVISTRDSPEMDATVLVVGRVINGMDVVERIAGVSTVKDNTGSPYFRVAKLIGDKRAVVAERGFNRPYVKVVVTDCGLLTE